MADVTRDFVAPFTLTYTYKRTTGPVIGQFLAGLRDQRILGARTQDGAVLVPASEYDPRTGRDTGDLVEVAPHGVIVTCAWVPTPGPRDPVQTPFAWALVRLDGADTAFLHAVVGPQAAVVAGARVRATWSDAPTGSVRDLRAFEVVP